MRPFNDWCRRTARGLFAMLMLLAWTKTAPHAIAQAGEPPTRDPSAEEIRTARTQFEATCRSLELVRRDLPRDGFDPQAVVNQVGREPDKLTAWVGAHTGWTPYRGMLRGPVGVLQDRSGNNLDRALLLGDLLRRSGQTVRLAARELDEADATKLWTVFAKPAPTTAPAAAPDLTKVAADAAAKYGFDPQTAAVGAAKSMMRTQQMLEKLAGQVASQEAALLKQLDLPAAAADKPTATELVAARDYWWVQYRDGEKWVDADVLGVSGAAPARTIDWPVNAAMPAIDEALCHTVTVRVVAEKFVDGKLTTATALEQALRPAELIGRRVMLYHHPSKWPADLTELDGKNIAARWREAVVQQTEWIPMLSVDETTYMQAGIQTNGDLNATPTFVSIKQAGKAVGGAGALAAGLLDAPAPSPPVAAAGPGVWSAEWIELEFKRPGGETRTERRTVFDLLGPAARVGGAAGFKGSDASNLTRGLSLTGTSQFLVTPCKLDPTFVQDLAIGSLLDTREALLKGLDALANNDVKGGLRLFETPPFTRALYEYALLRHMAGRWRDAVYVDQPNVTAFHQRLAVEGKGELVRRTILDIVANDVAVRPGTEVGTRRVRLNQGIVDTNAESLVTREPAHDLPGIIAAAEVQGTEWVTLRSVDDAGWAKLKLNADAAASIRADLARGATVVAPARAVARNGQEYIAWWRVDSASGACLGMSQHGGGVMAERAVLMTSFLWSTATGFVGCGGAKSTAPMSQVGVCAACAIGVAALSTLAFAGTGSYLTKSAPAVFANGAGGSAAGIVAGGVCNLVGAAYD